VTRILDAVALLSAAKIEPSKEEELTQMLVRKSSAPRHEAGNIIYELHEVIQ
jgi:quinol monooxygenase YgiN